jgi:hypothetical protein
LAERREIGRVAPIIMARAIERPERLRFARRIAVAFHRVDREYFVIKRAICVGHHMKLRKPIRLDDLVEALAEKIDHRRAKQIERFARNILLEAIGDLAQRNQQVHRVAGAIDQRRLESLQTEEQVTLRHREIFAQESIPFEGARARRE